MNITDGFIPQTSTRLKILSVDSDAVVNNDCILRRRGHDVTLVGTGRAALEQFGSNDFILLNMSLPDMDAFRVCAAIRQVSRVPIIAIVNGDDEMDRVLSLRAGADDCVRKSCGFHEVAARMDAILSRVARACDPTTPGGIESVSIVELGALVLDTGTREAWVSRSPVNLTDKEFELLAFLARRFPGVASRKEILRQVWDTEWNGASRTIDSHVSSLRSKLGLADLIVSVRGVGYRIGKIPNQSETPVSISRSA